MEINNGFEHCKNCSKDYTLFKGCKKFFWGVSVITVLAFIVSVSLLMFTSNSAYVIGDLPEADIVDPDAGKGA